jgi:hypothetical protein
MRQYVCISYAVNAWYFLDGQTRKDSASSNILYSKLIVYTTPNFLCLCRDLVQSSKKLTYGVTT